jgi:hypothetical protein
MGKYRLRKLVRRPLHFVATYFAWLDYQNYFKGGLIDMPFKDFRRLNR